MQTRPYIICLMMTTLDGKILTENWGSNPKVKELAKSFETIHETFGIGAWIVGRTTMEKDFTEGENPVFKTDHGPIDRNDFVAAGDASSFAIALDAQGKLGWKAPLMKGDHVITILTEKVSDDYLAHLQEIGVSYIFAGTSTIDLHIALEKLYTLFHIEKLMLEGGGRINGSFLNEDLIDEYHQLLLPLADGSAGSSTVFEIDAERRKPDATLFQLEEVKKIEHDVLWLKYKPVNDAKK
jgi:riboflavin biosynthesis pyrimidine reductase